MLPMPLSGDCLLLATQDEGHEGVPSRLTS